MRLFSPDFDHNQEIPLRYTAEGENESPPLRFEDVPEDAVSLTLIVHDPDAPTGDFVHWVVWNIDPAVREMKAGVLPFAAQQGENDYGKRGYEGPNPPEGTGVHHYHFELFALDTDLDLPADTTRDDLLFAMEDHEIDRAELIGSYEKEGELVA
ncbi:YbhB/YbcL family Raf kinase inhibitor-like protein [Candidatus Peregrinibacteria bacterium]|nr:YbhB/YbcL family Raf kinase inhibitor-like protein [Candidatus Peregrinibacteria bacterium]